MKYLTFISHNIPKKKIHFITLIPWVVVVVGPAVVDFVVVVGPDVVETVVVDTVEIFVVVVVVVDLIKKGMDSCCIKNMDML